MGPVMETATTWTMTAELGMTMTRTEMVAMNQDDYSLSNANLIGTIRPEGLILGA